MTTPPTISQFWINLLPTPQTAPRPDIPATPDDPNSLLTQADLDLAAKSPAENLPYLFLPGSSKVDSGLLADGANTLFPVPDGTPGNYLFDFFLYPTTGQPPDIGESDPTKLSTNSFAAWATGFQLQYLKAHTSPVPLLIGSNAGALSTPIHAMLSSDGKKVYILENLQKSDFAKMSTADQQLIAGTDYFKNTLADKMGFIPSSTKIDALNPTINDAFLASPTTDAQLAAENPVNGVPTGVSTGKVVITVHTAAPPAGFGTFSVTVQLGGQKTKQAVQDAFNNTLATSGLNLSTFVSLGYQNNALFYGPTANATSVAIDYANSTATTLSDLGINVSTANMTGKFNVTTNATAQVDVSSVDAARTAMINFIAGSQAIIANQTFDGVTATSRFTKDAGQVFIDELENLKTRVSGQSVFSLQDIKDQIAAITTRFNHLLAFGTVVQATEAPGSYTKDGGQVSEEFINVISTDNNATINSGYDKMLTAEKRILQLDNQAMAVSGTGVLTNGANSTDKHLDAPALIFMFQLNANQTLQQTNVINTEMVNQQNALLKTYGIIQQIIHQTEGTFNSGKQDEKRGIFGLTSDNNGDAIANVDSHASQEQLLAISMFEDILGNTKADKPPASQLHPIEKILGLPPRPTGDFYVNGPTVNAGDTKVTLLLSTEWGQIETALSDQVTLINQNNQIAMNDINSMQKQQDRHFDLANNALSKAADMIQSIGRNVAG